MRILIVFGTRPEIIKMAPVIKAARQRGHECKILHTGQHYSPEMSAEILKDTGIKEDINLNCCDEKFNNRFSAMLIGLQKEMENNHFDCVLAEGDTDSVLAGALAAHKFGLPFGHVESGLRSFDRTMPEENNRVLTDQISDFLFAPTRWSYEYLLRNSECRMERVFLTGNPVIDAMNEALKKASNSQITEINELSKGDYVLVTVHRAENVDNRDRLTSILESLSEIKQTVVFPLHPRTKKRIEEFHLGGLTKKLKIVSPAAYFDFISLCMNSRYIITDSGGIQEECSVYKKPVILVRENTERPEVINTFVQLVGTDKRKIRGAIEYTEKYYDSILEDLNRLTSPYGDGDSGRRIIETLEGYF